MRHNDVRKANGKSAIGEFSRGSNGEEAAGSKRNVEGDGKRTLNVQRLTLNSEVKMLKKSVAERDVCAVRESGSTGGTTVLRRTASLAG